MLRPRVMSEFVIRIRRNTITRFPIDMRSDLNESVLPLWGAGTRSTSGTLIAVSLHLKRVVTRPKVRKRLFSASGSELSGFRLFGSSTTHSSFIFVESSIVPPEYFTKSFLKDQCVEKSVLEIERCCWDRIYPCDMILLLVILIRSGLLVLILYPIILSWNGLCRLILAL